MLVTYFCGHEGEVNISEKQSFLLKKIEGELCPDCKLERVAVAEDKLDMPDLRGSDAQIKWARTIRFEKLGELVKDNIDINLLINMRTDAHWWIEARNWTIESFKKEVNEVLEKEVAGLIVDVDWNAIRAKREATIVPQADPNGLVVELKGNPYGVTAVLDGYNEQFKDLMKELRYRWSPDDKEWELEVDLRDRDYTDRMAETILALLGNGFTVVCYNETARMKAAEGTYSKRADKLIAYSIKNKRFSIEADDKDIISNALIISGSKYRSGSVYVDIQYADQVMDFAQTHDFETSPAAKEVFAQFEREFITEDLSD